MTIDSFVRDRLPPTELLPEFRFDLPELQYPERLNAAAELLKGGDPGALAFVNDYGRWTYADLDDFSGRIARLLVDQEGLVPGNRVLLRGPNGYTMFAAWLGVLKAGGVVVATMPLLRPGEIATVIERANISHAIVDSRFIGDFRQAVEQTHSVKHILRYDGDHGRGELETRTAALDPLPPADTGRDDPALIAFTSGTTGVPKGCVQFHRDVLAPCDSFARHLIGMKPGDIALTSAPLAFTFGLGAAFLFPLRAGAACCTVEQPSPPAMLEAIAKHGVTHLGTAPTAYKAMLATEGDGPDVSRLRSTPTEVVEDPHSVRPERSRGAPSSDSALSRALKTLRYCLSAGEHLPEATWRAWHERTGIAITDGIGSTEMMHIFISAAGDDIRPGSTGKAVPGYTATVLDADDQPMDEGTGRLALKGPTGCRYLDDERQKNYVVDGWNVTGDTYRKDADSYYWYLARSDDMIVSSGYNIGAPEVENALLAHPAVAECAVIGVPCPERGQKVKAFVVLAGFAEASDELAAKLQDFAKEQIAPYKYPREITFVEALPKTATGKLRRSELREPK
ncbi:AMP-binding protein [Sphingomonas lutea]|uniref:AMP-binding protein n=1 Tax=Sphingomonas lutea TaxID=1045317 RepID=A0A7G9SJY8_9SPHN|nr:AMP-binding protein [Sphingomonas lutea]QNN68163.1 AMP-binding protein [Sphingomonas lutea]